MGYHDQAVAQEGLLVINKPIERLPFDVWANYDVAAQITRFDTEKAHRASAPDDVSLFGYPTLAEGLLVDTGGNYVCKALKVSSAASGAQPDTTIKFDNTNAKIGVGDSSTAAAVGQTNLQAATNKLRKGMDATFPLLVGDQYSRANPTTGATETVTLTARQIVFRSTYASSEANFAWNEFIVVNHITDGSGTMLDRFVSAQGTKATGQVWEVTITFTFS